MTKKRKFSPSPAVCWLFVVVGSFALNRNNGRGTGDGVHRNLSRWICKNISPERCGESQSGRKVYSTLSYLMEQVNVQSRRCGAAGGRWHS